MSLSWDKRPQDKVGEKTQEPCPGGLAGLRMDAAVVSSVGSEVWLEHSKNESGRVIVEWSTEALPPGVSPSAPEFIPWVGIYCIVTGPNLRSKAQVCKKYCISLWSLDQPSFDSKLPLLWAGCCLAAKSCLALAAPWTEPVKSPLSMGLSRQEYWSGSPFPSPGDLPNPGIKLGNWQVASYCGAAGSSLGP